MKTRSVVSNGDFETRRRNFLLFVGLSVLFVTSALWWPMLVSTVWEPSLDGEVGLQVIPVYGPLFGSAMLTVETLGMSCQGLGCLGLAGILHIVYSFVLALGIALGLNYRRT